MKKFTLINAVLLSLILAFGVRIHLAPVGSEIDQGSCCSICYGDTIAEQYRAQIMAAVAQRLKLSPGEVKKLVWFEKEISATGVGRFLYLDPFLSYDGQVYAVTVRAKRYWIRHYYEWKITSSKTAALE